MQIATRERRTRIRPEIDSSISQHVTCSYSIVNNARTEVIPFTRNTYYSISYKSRSKEVFEVDRPDSIQRGEWENHT